MNRLSTLSAPYLFLGKALSVAVSSQGMRLWIWFKHGISERNDSTEQQNPPGLTDKEKWSTDVLNGCGLESGWGAVGITHVISIGEVP